VAHSPRASRPAGRHPGQPQHQTGLRGGGYLSFNLNLNLAAEPVPRVLPAHSTTRPQPKWTIAPTCRQLYCRVPQDSPFNVRGAANIPCETKPGNAPDWRRCASDETTSRSTMGNQLEATPTRPRLVKPIPNYPGHSRFHRLPAPPIAVAQYDPTTGH